MYGMINRAITQFIKKTYGQEIWERVVSNAGIQDETRCHTPYPNQTTVDLVEALSDVTARRPSQLLISIGEYWVELAQQSEFGETLKMAGDTLPDVLSNLDALHNQSVHTADSGQTLSFWISDLTEDSLILHFASGQDGLSSIVVGMVRALSNSLDTGCSIIQVGFRGDMGDHDEFAVAFEKYEIEDIYQHERFDTI